MIKNEIIRSAEFEVELCLHLDEHLSDTAERNIISSLKRNFLTDVNHKANVCLFIHHDVNFEPYFLNDVAQVFNIGNKFAYSDYLYVGSIHQKDPMQIYLPDWSPERFLAIDYLGPVVAVERDFALSANIDHQKLSRSEISLEIMGSNLPGARLMKYGYELNEPELLPSRNEYFYSFMGSNKNTDIVSSGTSGITRISHKGNAPDLVSVVIPTRGATGNSAEPLILNCIRSLTNQNLENTRVELIIVYDTDANIDYLSEITEIAQEYFEIVFSEYSKPFNFSEKCNQGASLSSGDIIVFLNDDTEWLNQAGLLELVGTANLEGIGAAGAKLTFPDGALQHAGFVVRNGGVGHAYFRESDAVGVGGDLYVTHEVMGVTGAVFAQRKIIWETSGGWDETLPSSYNDVDYCFRLSTMGYRLLQVNATTLIHFESATRNPALKPFELKAIQRRWPEQLQAEKFMRFSEANPPRRRSNENVIQAYIKYGYRLFQRDGIKGLFGGFRNFLRKLI